MKAYEGLNPWSLLFGLNALHENSLALKNNILLILKFPFISLKIFWPTSSLKWALVQTGVHFLRFWILFMFKIQALKRWDKKLKEVCSSGEKIMTKSKEVNLSESFFQFWIQVLVNWFISLWNNKSMAQVVKNGMQKTTIW